MGKEMRNLEAWIEVAPAILVPHIKTSILPALETIAEEELKDEELDE